jgi:hypothetical protein
MDLFYSIRFYDSCNFVLSSSSLCSFSLFWRCEWSFSFSLSYNLFFRESIFSSRFLRTYSYWITIWFFPLTFYFCAEISFWSFSIIEFPLLISSEQSSILFSSFSIYFFWLSIVFSSKILWFWLLSTKLLLFSTRFSLSFICFSRL